MSEGIWIAAEIWNLPLLPLERIFLAKISSLDDGGGCWAGDDKLSEYLRTTPQYIRKLRGKLEKAGYIERVGYGNSRRLILQLEEATTGTSNHRNKQPQEQKKQPEAQLEATTGATRSNHRSEDYRVTIEKTIEITKEREEEIDFPFKSEAFRTIWKEWKEYKRREHRFTYKSMKTELATLHKLQTDVQENERIAIAAIGESIARNWKGIFVSRELKKELSGSANSLRSPEARAELEEYIRTGKISGDNS